MRFKNRETAGKLLARALQKYKGQSVYVFALPRGGVVTGVEVANYLGAPLGLVLTRKIGHPMQPEYAVAAVSESGYLLGNTHALEALDQDWLDQAIDQEVEEIKRRHKLYLGDTLGPNAQGGIAILVDDGVATGLSLRAGVMEIRDQNPQKIVVASPIIPDGAYSDLKRIVDEVVALVKPDKDEFLGSVGSYYSTFPQVTDAEVIYLLNNHEETQMNKDIKKVLEATARW